MPDDADQEDLVPPYKYIRDRLMEGTVIPFLGCGASLSGQPHPPSAEDLASKLADVVSFPRYARHDLGAIAEYSDLVIGRGGLRVELHKIFSKKYAPSAVHRLLAAFAGPILIVTTNYDTLIEDALRSNDREFDLVVQSTTAGYRCEEFLWWKHGQTEPDFVSEKELGARLHVEERTVVYKIHGTVMQGDGKRDRYVITEDDYVEILARMTRKPVLAPFAEAFASRAFLFLGYGLHDWNLRVILKRIQNHRDRMGRSSVGTEAIKSWAIQHAPSAWEALFWQQHHIKIFKLPIDEFCMNLNLQHSVTYAGNSAQCNAGGQTLPPATPQRPPSP